MKPTMKKKYVKPEVSIISATSPKYAHLKEQLAVQDGAYQSLGSIQRSAEDSKNNTDTQHRQEESNV